MYRIKINNETVHEPDDRSAFRLSAGKITDEVNHISSFVFTIPASNPYFSAEINDRTDTVTVKNTMTSDAEFEGYILDHHDSMDSNGRLCKRVIAESFLGYLCDSIQMYRSYHDSTPEQFLQALLDAHNAQVSPEKHIELGVVNITRADYSGSKTTAYRSTLDEIKVNLIDRLGGEIRVRKLDGVLYLDYLQLIGDECRTTIELAKNMKSLNIQTDTSGIVTRLIPLGAQINDETAERLTISEVNNGKPYIDDETAMEKYGVIVGTAVFDDITLPENLKSRAAEYFAENNRVRKAYSAQVLDLSVLTAGEQSIKCGNSYIFRNQFFGLNERLRVTRRVADICKPYTPEIQIGDKTETVADIAARSARLIEYDLPRQKHDILTSAKAIASALIKFGFRGHVIANDEEICIMDTADKSTATKVWRFNLGGFGYSSSGYDGTYTIAMTMDGGFNADFITAGVIRGIEFINGDGTFHVHPDGTVEASALNISGGSINIQTSSETEDVMILGYHGNHLYLNPMYARLVSSHNSESTLISGNAISGYSHWSGADYEQTFQLSSATGNIATKGDILLKNENGEQSLRAEISSLWEQIQTIYFYIDALTGGGS